MPLQQHLAHTFHLKPDPSPWPRMILSALSVCLPLAMGYLRDELPIAIFGALFGFIMILNDHFGPLVQRVIHLVTAYLFILSGVMIGLLLNDDPWLLMIALFTLSFILGKSKGFGLELERMLLFTTLQLLAASHSPDLVIHFPKAFFYSTISIANYLISLFFVWLILRHKANFQKSKRKLFLEAFRKKGTNRYAATLGIMACLGLVLAHQLRLEKGYWVVGTILVVMVPDKKISHYRSFQRLIGSLIGVVLASLLMKLEDDPLMLIFFCTMAAFLAPLGLIKNYGLANIFIGGLILFLLEISNLEPHHGDFDLAITRMIDIFIGCILGSIGTFIAFPGSFAKRVHKLFNKFH
jgi:uncharacterized membrane protein YccC